MALSYTGLLFKRILISTGYTHGQKKRTDSVHIMVKWHYPLGSQNTEFGNALKWLDDNGYVSVKWNTKVKVSRNTSGMTDFITVTEKGYSVAAKYIR